MGAQRLHVSIWVIRKVDSLPYGSNNPGCVSVLQVIYHIS